MKLNFMCHYLSGNGGVETVLTDVLNYLSKDNDVTLTLTNEPENENWLRSLSNKIIIKKPMIENKVGKVAFFSREFISSSQDEIMIILGANLIKLGYKIRKIFNKRYKIVSWIHFSLNNQDMFDPNNIKYADRHWAISTAIKNELEDLGISSEEIDLIYNPVNHNTLITKNNSDTLKLAYIGRMQITGQKNLSDLLEGIRQYKGKIRVDFFGTGKDDLLIKEYIEKYNLEKKIIWHGWVKNPWDKLKELDATILTSNYEGLPMVFLESISRGIPVISSKFLGYTDVVKENINGYSYNVGNIQELLNCMVNIKNMDYNSSKIQESISQCYSENYLEKLELILKKI